MILETFNTLRAKAQKQRTEPVSMRVDRLKKVYAWVKTHETEIEEALFADFKKPAFETQTSEIIMVLSELKTLIRKTKCWSKSKTVTTPLSLIGHKSHIRYEPKGVVLIISPWNYPFQLSLLPLVTAIAAGNTAIVKPSELTPHTSKLVEKLVLECFSPDEAIVIQGDKDITQDLLNLHFNHVFFTGSTDVGKIIAQKCAEKLIPCTLELGGKSPVFIDETADLADTAYKIYWGKFLNRGQTCVAPDLIFVHQKVKEFFLSEFDLVSKRIKNQPMADIITPKHADRFQKLTHNKLNLTTDAVGLIEINEANKNQYLDLLNEEIFGPVAPIITFSDLKDTLEFFHNDPLSLYIFARDENFKNKVLDLYPSGSVGINSLIVQLANHKLPFGGIGTSGQGRYHGHFGFLEFSHERAVIEHKYLINLIRSIFPPYTEKKKNFLHLIKKITT